MSWADSDGLSGGANATPTSDLGIEVEEVDRSSVLIRSPLVPGQHPHQLELVAIGVHAVDALVCPVAGLAGVSPNLDQNLTCGGELVDRVELLGQVVKTNRSSPLRTPGRADTEKAEVVVVARSRKPKERGVGAWFEGDDLHAEHVGVEVR